MWPKYAKITDYSIWNENICVVEVFSFDHFNDFGESFIKNLEKLSTDLSIIINLYEHEKIAENRLIDKICEVNYHQFAHKNGYTQQL